MMHGGFGFASCLPRLYKVIIIEMKYLKCVILDTHTPRIESCFMIELGRS
jgi:hypothetical protein